MPYNHEEIRNQLSSLPTLSIKRLVELAETIGKYIASDDGRENPAVKMNQIRRFLDGLRRIETELQYSEDIDSARDKITLLRPKLAYAAGRQRKNPKLIQLTELLDIAIKSTTNKDLEFTKLLKLVESIIAYHRYYGGEN